MKSLFTPSLFNLSISYLSVSNPSISKPSVSSPWSVWWIKQKEWLLTIFFSDFKRAGQKVEGFLHFVPLRRFYAVLFIPLFCRPREKCGTLWKTTWLHNVANIRQKDIKFDLTGIPTRSSWEWLDWVSERSSGSGLNTGSLTLLQQTILTHRKTIVRL